MSDVMIKPAVETMLPMVAGEARTKGIGGKQTDEEREKACEGFEAYFIRNMLKEMEKTTHISKKELPEQTYMTVAIEKVADFIAQRGIGVKEMLMRYTNKENVKVSGQNGDNRGK